MKKGKSISKKESIIISDFIQLFIYDKINIEYCKNNKNEIEVIDKNIKSIIFSISENKLTMLTKNIVINNNKNIFFIEENESILKKLLCITNYKQFNFINCEGYQDFPNNYILYNEISDIYKNKIKTINKLSFSFEEIKTRTQKLNCFSSHQTIYKKFMDYLKTDNITFFDFFNNFIEHDNNIENFLNKTIKIDNFIYIHINLKRYLDKDNKKMIKLFNEIEYLYTLIYKRKFKYILYENIVYVFNNDKNIVIPFSNKNIEEYINYYNQNNENIDKLKNIKDSLVLKNSDLKKFLLLDWKINNNQIISYMTSTEKSVIKNITTTQSFINSYNKKDFKYINTTVENYIAKINKQLNKQLELRYLQINKFEKEEKYKEDIITVFKELFPFVKIVRENEFKYSEFINITIVYKQGLKISINFIENIYCVYKKIKKGYTIIDNNFIKNKLFNELYKQIETYTDDEKIFLNIIENNILYFLQNDIDKIKKQVVDNISEKIKITNINLLKSLTKLNISINNALYLIEKSNFQQTPYKNSSLTKILNIDSDNLYTHIENMIKNHSNSISYQIFNNDKCTTVVIKNELIGDIEDIFFKVNKSYQFLINQDKINIKKYINILNKLDNLFKDYIVNTSNINKYPDINKINIYSLIIDNKNNFKITTQINHSFKDFISEINSYFERTYDKSFNLFITNFDYEGLKDFVKIQETNTKKKYNSLQICLANPILSALIIKEIIIDKKIPLKNINKFIFSLLKTSYNSNFRNYEKKITEILNYENTLPTFVSDILNKDEYKNKFYELYFLKNSETSIDKITIINNFNNHFKNFVDSRIHIHLEMINIQNIYDLYLLKEFTKNNTLQLEFLDENLYKSILSNIFSIELITKYVENILEKNNQNYLNVFMINSIYKYLSKDIKDLLEMYKILYSDNMYINKLNGGK